MQKENVNILTNRMILQHFYLKSCSQEGGLQNCVDVHLFAQCTTQTTLCIIFMNPSLLFWYTACA